uniref:Uncharacterized protein n=1 Tax=viral metagenome TaxID=1070528 RepID=A0A6M3IQH8_9ZZZZ
MAKISTIELHGRTFNVEKRNSEWETNYRDAKATTGKTKSEAIQGLKDYGTKKLIRACDYMDKQITRDDYFKAQGKRVKS